MASDILGDAKVPRERVADEILVQRVLDGDKQAFGVLVTKYQRRLTRLISKFVYDPIDVEDVVQESFIKAYRALPHFRGDAAFYTWLYRIGVNTAKNHVATQARHATASFESEIVNIELHDGEHAHDITTPEAVFASKQIARTVNAVVDALPVEQRVALVLREIDGLSYQEIARILRCPVGTVRSRIFRAREVIAEQLEPYLDKPVDNRW